MQKSPMWIWQTDKIRSICKQKLQTNLSLNCSQIVCFSIAMTVCNILKTISLVGNFTIWTLHFLLCEFDWNRFCSVSDTIHYGAFFIYDLSRFSLEHLRKNNFFFHLKLYIFYYIRCLSGCFKLWQYQKRMIAEVSALENNFENLCHNINFFPL